MIGHSGKRRHGRPTRAARSLRRKSVTLATIGIGASLLLSACGGASASSKPPAPSSTSGTTTSAPAKKAPYTIGLIAAATGALASSNITVIRGTQAWVKVIDAEGGLTGHKINIEFCDSQSTVTGSVACVTKVQNAGIVIFPGTPGQMAAVAPKLKALGKVGLTPDPAINPPAGSNIFQSFPSLATGVASFLKAAVASGVKSLGLVVTDTAEGTAISHGVGAAASHFGVSVTTEKISPTTQDATVQVEQLHAANVGMIYVGIVGLTAAVVLRAIDSLGLSVPVVVNGGDVYPSFLSATNGQMPATIYGAPPTNTVVPGLLTKSQSKAFATFKAAYKKVYHKDFSVVTTSFTGAAEASNVAEILLHLNGGGSLSQTEKYMLTHVVGGLVPLKFTKNPQDAIAPIGLAEAKRGAKTWSPCVTSSLLHC